MQADPQALWRRRSLRGFLEAAGHAVSPKKPGILETPEVDGGYTVRTYGTSHEDGVDSIQLEIASTLRDDRDKRTALIETLAYAIGNLVSRYAETRTLAAFQSVNLLSGDLVPIVTGQIQHPPNTNDRFLSASVVRQKLLYTPFVLSPSTGSGQALRLAQDRPVEARTEVVGTISPSTSSGRTGNVKKR